MEDITSVDYYILREEVAYLIEENTFLKQELEKCKRLLSEKTKADEKDEQ